MRQKAGHSMMRRLPSTHHAEAWPIPLARPDRHGERQKRLHPRSSLARTSRLEPPASERRPSRSTCSGKQRHPPCRLRHARKPEGQTTDATDTKVRETPSRGCSQASLYNTLRPHGSLGYRPPAPEVFIPATARAPRPDLLPANWTVQSEDFLVMCLAGRARKDHESIEVQRAADCLHPEAGR
jgi:hypothetical protein